MNLFGVGTWELLVIIVGALLIFGPGKLPEVMGQMGKAVRDLRRITADLTGEFERAVGDPHEIKRAINDELTGVKSSMTSAGSKAKREVGQVSTTVGKTVGGAVKSASSAASRSTTTTSTKSATSTAGGTKSATSLPKANTTGTASASGSGAKAGAAKAAAPLPPPKASKADPLADVFAFDGDAAVPASVAKSTAPARATGRASASTGTAPATPSLPASNGANGAASVPGGDALTRARQRRMSAGYGVGRQTTSPQD